LSIDNSHDFVCGLKSVIRRGCSCFSTTQMSSADSGVWARYAIVSPFVLKLAPHCDRTTSVILCTAPDSISILEITSFVSLTLCAMRLSESAVHSDFKTLPLKSFNSGRISPPRADANDSQLLLSLVDGISKKDIQRLSGDHLRIPVIGLTFFVRVRTTSPVDRLMITSERLLASSVRGLGATIEANSSPAGDPANSLISRFCLVTGVAAPPTTFTTHSRKYFRFASG
jgi:hypothetical protein